MVIVVKFLPSITEHHVVLKKTDRTSTAGLFYVAQRLGLFQVISYETSIPGTLNNHLLVVVSIDQLDDSKPLLGKWLFQRTSI